MSFVVDCPCCRDPVTLAQDRVGRVMACPHCSEHFTVPAVGKQAVPIAKASSTTASPRGMRFAFTCQRCGSVLEARDDQCDTAGRCPTCGAVFTVPQVDPNTGRAVGPAIVADDGQLPTPIHAFATAGEKAPQIRRLDDKKMVIVCPRCQAEMPVDADVCSSCGLPFTIEGASTAEAPGQTIDNLATAALSLGILSILSACLPVLGPVAVVSGIVALRRAERFGPHASGRGLAIAGIICGLASLAIFAVLQLI